MTGLKRVCAGAQLFKALALLTLLVCAQAASAAEGTVRRGPVPGFVAPANIPAPNPHRLRQVDGALYDLLYDTQVRVENGLETTYRRRVYKVLDRSALETGAQVSVKFDPSHESLILHRVAIIRGGRVLDVTTASDLDTIRQEEELDNGILTGTKTMLVRMPGVRVGDVIDVSWSWASRPPLWPGHYFGTFQLGWSTPVASTRLRIDLPAGTSLGVYRYRDAAPPTFRREAGRDIREWVRADPEPVVEDEGTPQWHRPWQRVSVSTMPEWKKIVDWALPLYAGANDFPPALEDEAARIEREGGSPELKALKALRLVQDSIRYTSLSIGTGSYKPRSPAAVAASGWGDCKDKAQLLIALLRRLGIEAWPALTDTDEGAALRREAPSPGAFDHVIAQLRIGGRTFWVDPTISQQGGTLASQAALRYRFALPIRPGQRDLEAIPLPSLTMADMGSVETYQFTSEGIRMDVVTLYTAGEADRARARFAAGALADREAEYLRYYSNGLPGLRVRAPLTTNDDRNTNRFVVRESYLLPPRAYDDGALLAKFPVNASTLEDIFTYPRGEGRRHPMALSYPIRRTHKVVFVTPGMSVSPPEEVSIDGKAFSFELKHERDGEESTLLFSLTGKAPLLAPEDFEDFRKDADALASNGSWTLAIGPGAAMGEGPQMALAALFITLFVLLVAGIFHAHARKDAQQEGEQFYPVPAGKFLLLSFSTWGVYQFYWFWRHWRWVKRHEEAEIMPFWRAFFGVLWLYPLFESANRRAARPLPVWLGGAAAALFLIWMIGTSVADNLVEDSFIPTAAGFLAVIFGLPALVVVNRSNPPERVQANGRWSWLAIAAFATGSAATLLLLLAA